MQNEGVHMGPGLPNTTSATQEMDDWFQEFKGRTDLKAQDIFEKKTYDHAISLKNRNNNGIIKIKSAALTDDDLPAIINGHPNDPQEKRPFDLCATPQKIFKSWLKVGFVLFTRNALKHKRSITCLVREVQVKRWH